eukprot:TRINITY_DN41_c0_g2_i1.p1 TRINITY_DN41_c0_g2~~TRINITY_DN41_c0_g2_i1.p1  ORF type:complete len:465 (-),score=122.95 TRINITY_DN41_c0_g2_i1:1453-2820(-)
MRERQHSMRLEVVFSLWFIAVLLATLVPFGADGYLDSDAYYRRPDVRNKAATIGVKEVTPQQLMTVLVGGDVYTPEPIGAYDILLGGSKILAMTPHEEGQLPPFINPDFATVINVTGMIVTPGIIDVHVHASGGGGELGPYSRTPEAELSQIIDGGVTTLIGLLGTDSVSRTLQNLYTKMRALEQEGLTTFMYTGAYRVPPPTLTESVMTDIILIDKMIGVGEIAISDSRSSCPTLDELTRIVSDARVAGMLSSKPGVAHFHVGSGAQMIDLLWEIVNTTYIPITNLYPTHMSDRGPALIEEGEKWIAAGGYLDFTADTPGTNDTETFDALQKYLTDGVDLTHVTLSSDSYGSFPVLNSGGAVISYGVGLPNAVLYTIQELILKGEWPINLAFQLATSNSANFLGFAGKGEVAVGNDADILVLDPSQGLELQYVFALGEMIKNTTWTKTAMFPCL